MSQRNHLEFLRLYYEVVLQVELLTSNKTIIPLTYVRF